MRGFHFTDSGEKMFGPQIMSTLNGYAEKSHGVLSQVFSKTAPKAQALRNKTMKPLAEATSNKTEHAPTQKKPVQIDTKAQNSTANAQQQT